MKKALTRQMTHESEEPWLLNGNQGFTERWRDISKMFGD